jgi:hypothetical protein
MHSLQIFEGANAITIRHPERIGECDSFSGDFGA